MRLGSGFARWAFVSVWFGVLGCAGNPSAPGDGSVVGMDAGRPDGGGVGPVGRCGGSGGACCAGRICELGLACGSGDVCCTQAGGGARCGSASDCCRGLACQGGSCCAPRTAACTGSADCCAGLVCSGGGCLSPDDDLPEDVRGCGGAGGTCCPGFTCRSGLVCDEGSCRSCGDSGQPCCDGATSCVGSLACDVRTATCVNADPATACGEIDNPCCDGATGTPTDCSGALVCRGGRCFRPDDSGFDGAPCGPRGTCDPGLVCDRRGDPSGLCGETPSDCGRDGQMCCDLGGSSTTCEGSLNCQFGDCSTCRGPSLTCLLSGLLPGQQCCSGSVCRPAPLIPRCCMGQGGQCENSLDCCGLMFCGSDGTCSCSRENSFCLDSSECCDGLTCDRFLCRPAGPACSETGATCAASSECCAGLACSETRTEPTAPAVRQCCSGGGTSCTSNEDCCGRMQCDDGECECVTRAGLCDRDIECCDGDICIVGSCQDGRNCLRERQVCGAEGTRCCGMLSCLRHLRDAADYCCVTQSFRCRVDTDCCGRMSCNSDTERCEAVAEGGDCDTQLDCDTGLSCVAEGGQWRCRRPPV